MPAQTAFDVAAVLFALAALFGYVNHRLLHLPQSIGLVLIALVSSVSLLAFDALVPGLGVRMALRAMVSRVDFAHALMDGALSFLLFRVRSRSIWTSSWRGNGRSSSPRWGSCCRPRSSALRFGEGRACSVSTCR